MVDRTHRHYRYFLRLLSKHVRLYTEMITAAAVIHGDEKKLLDFDPSEKPLVLQLAGSSLSEMKQAVSRAENRDYDELNLNAGCPSARVQSGELGACLMKNPEHTACLWETMQASSSKPVSVKCRIGVRDENISLEDYDHLRYFVETLSRAGCRKFTVHARIAILKGLSPEDNRKIPPLRYGDVYRIKEDFPDLAIEINGGIRSSEEIKKHLEKVDGVMLGRVIWDRPWLLTHLEKEYAGTPIPARAEILEKFFPYIEEWSRERVFHPVILLQGLFSLFAFHPGTKKWKQHLGRRPLPQGKELIRFLREGLLKLNPETLESTRV